MPIYEYKCRKCNRKFELLTTIAQADKAACKFCGSPQTNRQLSVFGVSGSGKSDAGGDFGGCEAGGCDAGGSCDSCPMAGED